MAHPVFLDQTHNQSKIITLSKPVFKTRNSSLSNLMWLSWNCTKVLKKRNKSTSSPPSSLSSPLYLESHVTKTSAFCKESRSYWQESICREREQNLYIFFSHCKTLHNEPFETLPSVFCSFHNNMSAAAWLIWKHCWRSCMKSFIKSNAQPGLTRCPNFLGESSLLRPFSALVYAWGQKYQKMPHI